MCVAVCHISVKSLLFIFWACHKVFHALILLNHKTGLWSSVFCWNKKLLVWLFFPSTSWIVPSSPASWFFMLQVTECRANASSPLVLFTQLNQISNPSPPAHPPSPPPSPPPPPSSPSPPPPPCPDCWKHPPIPQLECVASWLICLSQFWFEDKTRFPPALTSLIRLGRLSDGIDSIQISTSLTIDCGNTKPTFAVCANFHNPIIGQQTSNTQESSSYLGNRSQSKQFIHFNAIHSGKG